jgi:hypothetical protein
LRQRWDGDSTARQDGEDEAGHHLTPRQAITSATC